MPMPLRPQAPMQRGFGSRMMPPRYQGGFQRGYQGGFQGGMPFAQFHHPQQMAGPMMSRNGGGSKGGGLLAKILGKGKEQEGFSGAIGGSMNRAASGGGGGILKTLTNPDALNGLLNNTQTVIKTAQQLGPVIQQYGPLVRNLPSLWKLYKGLKDVSNENDDSSQSNENESSFSESTQMESSEDQEFIEINPILDKNSVRTSKKRKKPEPIEEIDSSFLKNRRSVPKMYI